MVIYLRSSQLFHWLTDTFSAGVFVRSFGMPATCLNRDSEGKVHPLPSMIVPSFKQPQELWILPKNVPESWIQQLCNVLIQQWGLSYHPAINLGGPFGFFFNLQCTHLQKGTMKSVQCLSCFQFIRTYVINTFEKSSSWIDPSAACGITVKRL